MDEKLNLFFKYWSELVNNGEVSSLSPIEVRILQIYKDWEIEHEQDIQELFGGSKRD